MDNKGMINVAPKMVVELGLEPEVDYHWNGYPFNLGGRELVPDQKVRHLYKRVNALQKWSRGRTMVTGTVRGALYGTHGDYIYLVECEQTGRLFHTGRPQVIGEGQDG